MEEIDIIELLKRVKEGKAPKRIQIGETRYELNGEPDELEETDIEYLYLSEMNERTWIDDMQPLITIQTKIKILDKPIIEELNPSEYYFKDGTELVYKKMFNKINEIIRYLRSK